MIAILLFNVAPTFSTLWPFALIAAWGVIGAIADVVRWLCTRYRITDTEVERRTGVILRRRLWWATGVTASIVGFIALPAAAGWSAYEAPDIAESEATSFAALAAPGVIDEFLDSNTASGSL